MKFQKEIIKSIILPFLFVFPLMGTLACSSDEALMVTNDTFDVIGEKLADLPENVEAAAPMLQRDIQDTWVDVSGQMQVYGEEIGFSEPHHPLAEAQNAREKLISGVSFQDLLAKASGIVTTDDLSNIHSSELSKLNGILPFDINVDECGESLAEVLNSLDIGQVSSILESEQGFHLIQLVNRDGARVRIGHLIFEIDPQTEYDIVETSVAEQPEGMDEAIAKLNEVLAQNW